MLRNKPVLTYSGLTIIMSKPSRNDLKRLLTGTAGFFFNQECLHPDTSDKCADIRLADDISPLLEGTKVLMLLGQKAFSKYTGSILSLDEARGSPYVVNGIYAIPSFSAQDAIDPKDYESADSEEDEEASSDELKAGEVFAEKSRGRTARSNYRFWLKRDTKKALYILKHGKLPYVETPNYIIDPPLDIVCDVLNRHENLPLLFDMETDFISMDMRCFGFSFDYHNIYTVPTLTTGYKPYFGKDQWRLHTALAKAVKDNTLIAHNGQKFDFLVLGYKYGIPVRKTFDTLLAAHRIYPLIEKSLGHWISLCTYEMFHKNEGAHGYMNHSQAEQLYKYNGKDVFTLGLVHKWQLERMSEDRGLFDSVTEANDSTVPYLTTTLTGMKYQDGIRQKWITENDELMRQYMRIMTALLGPDIEPLISNKKTVEYFHNRMRYRIVKRTATGNASLAADALYKLALKHPNPVIKFLIRYREVQKETGTLNFNPWKVAA